MTRFGYSAVLLFSLLASGCNLMPVKEGDLEPQVNAWVADKQYGRAIEALAAVDPKNPRYPHFAEHRRQVESFAASYEREVVERAAKDVAAGRWAAALDAYDDAMERLPKSTVLRDGLGELHRKQAIAIAREELDLLVARARWLRDTQADVAAIARIAPRDSKAQERLAEHRNEIDRTARQLAKLGSAALAAGDYRIAERALPLAAELSEEPEVRKAHAALKSWVGEQQARKKAASAKRLKEAKTREEAARRRFESTLTDYQAAFDAGNYREAANLLSKLEAMAPGDEALGEERARIDSTISEETARLYETGVGLYSRGEFEQAVEVWRRAIHLSPNHRETRESLERAERVLEKLQQLREKQVGVHPGNLNG